MTGKSLFWKMTRTELKAFAEYCKKPVSACLIMGGTGLMLEHLFSFGGFDLLDFWGHEYLGAAMIGAGFLVSVKWGQWKELKLSDIRKWIR